MGAWLSESDWRRSCRIPGYDPWATAPDGWEFDVEAANHACEFFPRMLRHVEGKLYRTPFVLEDWQRAIIGTLFGWKREDGTRRYRECFLYVPRKNGKSPLAAGIANLVLFHDNEAGQQNVVAAAKADQAALLFRHARGMVEQNDLLRKNCDIFGGNVGQAKRIVLKGDGSYFSVIATDSGGSHGGNLHLALIDELHAQDSAEFVEVLQTSMASANRPQPLMVLITTADYLRESICNTKYKYAHDVIKGIIDDPAFLPVLYEASREDDWKSEDVWAKANPNLGVSVSLDYLRRESQRAKDQPSYENTFKRLHLNIQTESVERWLPMDRWDLCDSEVDAEALRNKDCFAGLDLSSTQDITAFVLYFPETRHVLPFMWLPGESAEMRQRHDGVKYTEWVSAGLIEETSGNYIDQDAIFDRIVALGMQYNIRQIAFDGWQAAAMYDRLTKHGFDCVKFPQTMKFMNSPSKRLEAIVGARELRHGGHPVLRWMAANTVKQQDHDGHIRPSKAKSSEKIDGIVALIMAIGAAEVSEDVDWYTPGGLAL